MIPVAFERLTNENKVWLLVLDGESIMGHVVGAKHTNHKHVVPKIENNIILTPANGLNNLQPNGSAKLEVASVLSNNIDA